MQIDVKLLDDQAKIPNNAYTGDAGYDLYSIEDTSIKPQSRKVIHTGVSIAIPKNYCGLIIPRSGLAAKHGISVVNAPGLIDSGYRGELCVILINTDNENVFKISKHDRIAQLVIVKHEQVNFNRVDKLDISDRQNNKFGSSGY